jgi:FAD/FMN-containing dehydrogenase/Fe-S oxidoreductase
MPPIPPHFRAALDELRATLAGEVRDDDVHRALYATDASIYELVPVAVALPRTGDDLAHIVRICARHALPITARTAGTSLSGQAVGPGLVVDTGRYLNRIVAFDAAARTVTVEPGVVRDELNRFLKPHGLLFGPDTSTSNRCMIGGMVGNNSCGSYSIWYGTTRESLVSLDVVFADGTEATVGDMDEAAWMAAEQADSALGRGLRALRGLVQGRHEAIREAFPKPDVIRRNTGYALDDLTHSWLGDAPARPANLARLLCGSEGTLALTRTATLRLSELPRATMVVASHFETIDEALRATVEAVRHRPAAVELLDKRTLDLAALNLEQDKNRWFLEGDPGAILVIEFFADSPDEARAACERVVADLCSQSLGYAHPIIAPPRIHSIWELRKAGLGVLMGSPGDVKPQTLVEDTAVSVVDLPAYIREFAAVMARHSVACVYYAHASVGELHMRPELDFKDPADVARASAIAADVADLVKKYRGSLSGEHGDGRVRGPYIERVMGSEAYGWIVAVKRAFDPVGLMNPNNIVDTQPMENDWRYHPSYRQNEVPTVFGYAESGGFQRAIERCNGAGVCRKGASMGGTMCPSYMVTGEERETTRGRANLFRLLLQQGATDLFSSDELGEALDLCVGCKGCKSECPASVDMARLKTEYLQGRHDARGAGLGSRAFAEVTEWSRPAQALPGVARLANWGQRLGVTRKVLSGVFGISDRRTMPALSPRSFHDWFAARPTPVARERKVCLFVDEFTDRYDTEVGIAAVELLEAGGFEVLAPRLRPSGRTYLSKGFARKARDVIGANVERLHALLPQVEAIVGVEPSALLTMVDEAVDFAGVAWGDKAREVATKVMLVEDFVARAAPTAAWRWGRVEGRVLLHGHCHQKALVGVEGAVAALALPGYRVEVIPSGCCGMAGSFGYEARHYDVSMAMGELVLFPAVRKAEPSTLVAAAGTSCRHQIHDGAARTARHPVQILRDALA